MGVAFGGVLSRETRVFSCYVEWLVFSSFVSQYFWAMEIFNIFPGPIFGDLTLCFSAFGENERFHSGFSFRIWAPVLWCFVFQRLALVICEPLGRLWRRLGLPLGLVGPPWARDRFCRFFGLPLWRCLTAQKTNGFGAIYAQRAVRRNRCK